MYNTNPSVTKARCVFHTPMPQQQPFFEKSDLDKIMSLTDDTDFCNNACEI